MNEVRFTVNVTPAQFSRVAELAVSLDIFPERKAEIISVLTEAWSDNGGFFVPSIARDQHVDEIKLVVINTEPRRSGN